MSISASVSTTSITTQPSHRCPASTYVYAFGFVIQYPNHYAEKRPFSFGVLTRAALTGATGTAAALVAARHAHPLPAENWSLAAEPLCTA